jgi:ABC-type sugar transport system substrate-binding protein
MSQIRTFLAGATTMAAGSTLRLKDAKGRARMVLTVSADGRPEIQMLDEQGKVSKSITPSSKD